MNTYSVLIRTFNSAKTIDSCLKSIKKQTYQPNRIIIVDNQSNDSTLEIASLYNCSIIEYPEDNEFNYSVALNIGIDTINDDYILILSSHCEFLFDDSVYYMISLFDKLPGLAGVSLTRTASDPEYKFNPRSSWKISSQVNFDGQALFNFCSMIPKRLWLEYPFNENIPSAEDQDWAKHFIMKYNMFTIIDFGISISYNNQYYNIRKDIKDYLVICKYIKPDWSNNKSVILHLFDAIQKIFKLQVRDSFFKFRLVYYLIWFRLSGNIPTSNYIIKSKSRKR